MGGRRREEDGRKPEESTLRRDGNGRVIVVGSRGKRKGEIANSEGSKGVAPIHGGTENAEQSEGAE